MLSFITLLMILSFSHNSYAQQKSMPVFISGTEGYNTFRIPAIINLKNGSLLAFCEGRVDATDDFGNIDIVMKRSDDKGNSWHSFSVVVDYNTLQVSNPAPVIDFLDPHFPHGRIFLFYNTGNVNENEIRKGNGLKEVWYKTSTDEGKTWSEPINITKQVHHPNQPKINPDYHSVEDWRYYANTPGHALQFKTGNYKGRIYVIGNHSTGDLKKGFIDYDVHGFYTDDHGKTFHLSNNLNMPGSNEVMAAELSDGSLMINARNQTGNPRFRIIAVSKNGGEKWDSSYYDSRLPDPVCQGSILNIHLKKYKTALVICNNNSAKERDNLTLRISYDNGTTWAKSFVIDKSENGYKGSYTAYSDLVQINKNLIGVLYEKDNYKQIVFKLINIKNEN